MPKMRIYKEFKFDSAHWLPNVPEGHKCANMHGHTYTIEIHVEDELDSHLGWVVDFNDVRRVVEPLIDQLDHKILNEIQGLENPTAEHIALWFWEKTKLDLPQLVQVVVKENPSNVCIYSGE
ncbi:MAG: 6-carboxytetrahydropterin synthase QueD [Kiritimatiellaceae bacterium]|nr:6-carboxytetrahydropterin synthase QueD [Kiritimatiellaceae bacterium]